MKKILMFSVVLMMSFSLVNAITCEELISITSLEEGTKLPGALPYKNEKFNVYQEEFLGSIIISDKIITKIDCGKKVEVPTYDLIINNEKIIAKLISSEKFVDDFDDALSNKDIEIKGHTFTKKSTSFLSKFAIKIASWFN